MGMSKWNETALPCKLGTIPYLVHIDGRSKFEVGKWVRVQDRENGDWFRVLVTRINSDGYFMADK